MDAIRKKMQSLKNETDGLFAQINKYEESVKEANARDVNFQANIRDLGKKITTYEHDFDETNDKLVKTLTTLEAKEKEFKSAEEDVGALSRRVMLMEVETTKSESTLGETVTKLAIQSKEADAILKKVEHLKYS